MTKDLAALSSNMNDHKSIKRSEGLNVDLQNLANDEESGLKSRNSVLLSKSAASKTGKSQTVAKGDKKH